MQAPSTLLGVVLNDVPTQGEGSYTGYYAEYTSTTTSPSGARTGAQVQKGHRVQSPVESVLEPQP